MERIQISSSAVGFRPMIGASVIFHGLVVAIFTFKALLFPSPSMEYRSAIRVDLIGLPDKVSMPIPAPLMAEKPKPVPLPQKQVAKPEAPKKNVVDLKKKQTSALDQLKALQAIEDMVNSEKKKEPEPKPVAVAYKGNRVSPGTSLYGLQKLEYESYLDALDTHAKQYWALPKWLATSDFRARARVILDERGYVIKKEIIRSSNNNTYDSLVLQAIENANPFPAPPDKFVNIVGVEGIVFGFPE